jgi:hypothetical protein
MHRKNYFFEGATLEGKIHYHSILNSDEIRVNGYKLDIHSEVTRLHTIMKMLNFYRLNKPVRIRVKINPTHPLVCRKRRKNGAVLRMRPNKPRPRVAAGVTR